MIKRLGDTPFERIPILIECHTKQYNQYYRDIEKFLEYVLEKYGDVAEFSSLSDFLKETDVKNNMIKLKTA
ncbi:MAG: hypothetical protein IPI54_07615 [Chitinophagaceae bacterium]|nr:hypothetical protein [Chitinophagaceae bacterium]